MSLCQGWRKVSGPVVSVPGLRELQHPKTPRADRNHRELMEANSGDLGLHSTALTAFSGITEAGHLKHLRTKKHIKHCEDTLAGTAPKDPPLPLGTARGPSLALITTRTVPASKEPHPQIESSPAAQHFEDPFRHKSLQGFLKGYQCTRWAPRAIIPRGLGLARKGND